MDFLTAAVWAEVALTVVINGSLGWLMWASGYAGMLWNLAKKHGYRAPPLDECTALNLL